MKWTREKGILSSGLIVTFIFFGKTMSLLVTEGHHSILVLIVTWFIGSIITTPFWLLFEALVEKIKE